MNKLLTTILLLSFSLVSYGATQGVSFNSTTKNVNQTDLKQGFATITNAAATASAIAGYDANKKLGSFTAAATRTLLEVPIFDLTDPGAVNIFPFWDDTGNEVDWTSNTALRTLLGIDSNDAVTFGPVTGDSFTAGSTNMVGSLAGKQPLDTDLTALAGISGVQGDVIYHNGTSWTRLAKGTAGQVLEMNAGATGPEWDTDDSGGGGSAPVGTMVSSGTAPVIYALYAAADTTGTNFIATGLYTDSTLTNLYFGGMFVGSMTLTNSLGVASGGTGLSSGTSGGVLYYSASGALASSGALAANAVVLGGGAGVAPSTTTTASGFVTWLGTPSSANFFTLITGETGSGAVVGGTAPEFTTTIRLPQGNDPDVTLEGHLTWDANGDYMRAYDGANQVAVGRKIEAIHATVVLPNDLADSERDAFWIWENVSGLSFIVTGWSAKSDTDDTTLNIEEIDGDGANNATVDAVEIATNGTGLFYASDTTITAATIETGHILVLDFDDADVPGQVKITIYGYFNADVN